MNEPENENVFELEDRFNETDTELYKPNELIAVISSKDINRNARHLFNYFLRYAQQQIKFNKNHKGNEFSLDLSGLNDLAGIDKHNQSRIENALDRLMEPVKFRDKDNPNHYTAFSLVPKIEVNFDKGLYKYKLADEVIQLLSSNTYFTKINLIKLNGLKSKYSIVFYELIKRYATAPKFPIFSIDELREITSTLNKKAYDNYSNFKKNVLDVAVSEINSITEFQVSYDVIREKRKKKVYAIKFFVSNKNGSHKDEETAEISDVFCLNLLAFQDCDSDYLDVYKSYKRLSRGRISLSKFYEYTYRYSLSSFKFLLEKAEQGNWKTISLDWLEQREVLPRKDEFLLERLLARVTEDHLDFVNTKIIGSYGFASVIRRLKKALGADEVQDPIL